MPIRVNILGAGIIGLTTGTVFQEAGYQVTITAKSFTPDTTSDKAAAIWLPFKAHPWEKVLEWSHVSFGQFSDLAKNKNTGVSFVDLILLEPQTSDEIPPWTSIIPEKRIKKLRPDQLPEDYHFGLSVNLPFIETPVYMPYLQNRFLKAGGRFIQKEIKDLEEWIENDTININCTGLGSRTLCNDTELFPIQGQIVKTEAGATLPYISDETSKNALAYVFPRRDGIILGGTAISGKEDLIPQQDISADIIRRCSCLVNNKGFGPVLETYVGLRPGRKSIRLEADPEKNLIHNYGHGGAGFTVSWGCANATLKLARELYCSTK